MKGCAKLISESYLTSSMRMTSCNTKDFFRKPAADERKRIRHRSKSGALRTTGSFHWRRRSVGFLKDHSRHCFRRFFGRKVCAQVFNEAIAI